MNYKTSNSIYEKRISFILITKDRPDLVQIALDNLKKILTKEDELILVNGGESNINNPLINKTIKEKDKSPGHAINKGIMISEGRYIRTVSDDDIIRKQQLNEAVDILDKNLSIDFLVCGGIRERENEKYPFYIPENSNYGKNKHDISKFGACGQGFIIRTSSLPLIGLHPTGLASDVEYVIQAIANGGNVKFCRINLFHHPIHKDSVTIKYKSLWQDDLNKIYKKYNIKIKVKPFHRKLLGFIYKTLLPTSYENRQKKNQKVNFNKDLLNENSPLWDKGFS
tara:strand:- start:5877 stop:6722 length:846 start_codon:yes stop_codon:yes gene_type:complete